MKIEILAIKSVFTLFLALATVDMNRLIAFIRVEKYAPAQQQKDRRHCCPIFIVRRIAALTREHGGWEQACLRTTDARSRVQCLVTARGARRGKAQDEVGAAITRDAVARNKLLDSFWITPRRWKVLRASM